MLSVTDPDHPAAPGTGGPLHLPDQPHPVRGPESEEGGGRGLRLRAPADLPSVEPRTGQVPLEMGRGAGADRPPPEHRMVL